MDVSHYAAGYDTLERFASYWYQIQAVLRGSPKSVLEVGVGNAFVAGYLHGRVPEVLTLDHDPALVPTILGSAERLPLRDGAVDTVLCAEVLEHLPYETAIQALSEFSRVANRAVVLSVPDATPCMRVILPVPGRGERRLLVRRWWARTPKSPRTAHEHYWELGLPGHSPRSFREAIHSVGLTVERDYRIFENPYHRLLELRVSER